MIFSVLYCYRKNTETFSEMSHKPALPFSCLPDQHEKRLEHVCHFTFTFQIVILIHFHKIGKNDRDPRQSTTGVYNWMLWFSGCFLLFVFWILTELLKKQEYI